MADLQQLYRQMLAEKVGTLKHAAARALWEEARDDHFKRFKDTLKKLGYSRLYVGAYPNGPFSGDYPEMVYAEIPQGSIMEGTPLWRSGVCDLLGGMSCGNGRKTYHQAQLRLHREAMRELRGVYDL